MAKNETIIIKKIKKGGGHGHHGGAWKVAYADFVTAMMCFFLVMWLMGSDEEVKAEIEHYFNHPNTPYNAGRDPASDTARPRGENDGPGDSVLRGLKGFLSDDDSQEPADRVWQVENANWRILLEEALLSMGTYNMESTPDFVRFSLNSEKFFRPGTAEISPSGDKDLRFIFDAISKYPGFLMVISHMSRNSQVAQGVKSPWDLSSLRASYILRYFVDTGGYDPGKITAIGYNTQYPVTESEAPQEAALNERIEFRLTRKSVN